MEHHETNADRLERLAARLDARLDERSLPEVDFDLLRRALSDAAEQERAVETMREELALLREDIIARIAGMTKATVAVERGRSGPAEALEYLESLPKLDGSALLVQYRRAAARFRDAFPASFGHLRSARKGIDEPGQYK